MSTIRFPFAFLLLAGLAPAQTAMTQSTLPIQRIVLYKHGVGYFEHQGKVSGSTTLSLGFKAEQMKDVLKSLYAVDLSGGRITTILYDSKDPVQKQLEDILFQVPEASALTQFLKQLKGAAVRVQVGTQAVEGRVLGIEPMQQQTQAGITTRHKLVVLRDGGAIEPIELNEAQNVTILDEGVRRDLGRMMDIYAKSRYADRKVVQLRAEGDGERTLRMGYIIETPIWKTSYRLLLDGQQPAMLQGWAIVENRTDEDWNEVMLTFVAGSPLSFVLDLYTSYYPTRPVVAMQLAAAESGLAAAPASKAGAPAEGRVASRRRAAPAADAAPMAPGAPPLGGAEMFDAFESSVAPVAQGVEVGDLFAYAATGAVTIKKGQAALVPILLERLPKGERTLYFKRELSRHPNHAFRLLNSTALTLEKGPITVFEGSTCLGEGMLQKTLKSQMHAIVPYALETGVEVEPSQEQVPQPVVRATLANGVLTTESSLLLETTYKIRNKSGKAHGLLLDHPKAPGFDLVEPKPALEELPDCLRFALQLEAPSETVFKVRERQRLESRVAVLEAGADQIRFYLREPYLSAKAKELLSGVVGLMDERAQAERGIAQSRQEVQTLTQEQERARQNLGVLRESPQERTMRERYLERILKSEERIDALNKEIERLTKRRDELEAQIRQRLREYRDE